ncbi:unnamed protein product [Pleuronectes platessa]|uniref:Uncharacterized protein n=1 Tax=Pleuronectes platessa TaxID=8262 RepID=A0A9N7VNV4_PLEPL|nr:unnamed protein product [Pleuronectes platessa]
MRGSGNTKRSSSSEARDKQGNKTVTPSQESADGTEHIRKGVPLSPPLFPANTCQARESLMFSWAVMAALTALICLRRQDESGTAHHLEGDMREEEGEFEAMAGQKGKGLMDEDDD